MCLYQIQYLLHEIFYMFIAINMEMIMDFLQKQKHTNIPHTKYKQVLLKQ